MTRFFGALDPALRAASSTTRCRARSARLGEAAGGLSERAAALDGPPAGTPVAVGNVDAHVTAPAVTVTEPGSLVAIMGTSICHVALATTAPTVPGMCGVVA